IGGGEYERHLRPPRKRKRYRVGQQQASADADHFETINKAIKAWRNERALHPDALIEIEDSGAYSEPIKEIKLKVGERLEIRARNGARPVIRVFDLHTSGEDTLTVSGPTHNDESKRAPQFTLDGVLITGRGLRIRGHLSRVTIRHCTLVPGWSLGHDCEPENEMELSLELINTTAQVSIERSIVGSILVDQNEVMSDPLRL